MDIMALDARHRDAVNAYIDREWGDPIVSRGRVIPTRALPGFVAILDGCLAGALLYRTEGDACEIVALFSLRENMGAGTGLIEAVKAAARAAGCSRVWLITMNDNTHAIRYYQRRGFDLVAAHINAFDVTRRLKKEPLSEEVLGIDDIPIRHELEFAITL